MEKNAEYDGQPITVYYEDSDKGTVFGEFFSDRPGIDILLYYPEERDDKGELIKAGHYVLLRRATLSQPENEKVYSLGDYVAICSETNDWDRSKEVKDKFMRKSGQYFLLTKRLEMWFPKSAIFHRCSIPSIDNRMHYSFDAIDIKGICDKIKTHKMETSRWAFIFANHSSNECNKKEVVDMYKNSIAFSCVSIPTNY